MPTFAAVPTGLYMGGDAVPVNVRLETLNAQSTFGAIAGGGGFRQSQYARIEWDGVGLVFDAQGRPIGGTITDIRLYFVEDGVVGGLRFDITDAAYDAAYYATAVNYAWFGDWLMGGADVIYGTPSVEDYGNVLAGGGGADTYYIDSVTDRIDEFDGLGGGYDTVISNASYLMDRNVEHLVLTGAQDLLARGNNGDNLIEGNAGANAIDGRAGHDTLLGGAGNDVLNGGRGADDMDGGTGDDTFHVDDPDDSVTEAAGEGIDRVLSRIDFTLPDHVERLSFLGPDDRIGVGNGLDNLIIGNRGADRLAGLDGDDVLRGGAGDDWLDGGDGADRLEGGAGADTFVFSGTQAFDRVMDFGAGDVLAFASGLFATAEEALAALRTTATGDAVFLAPGIRVVIAGVAVGDIGLDDIRIIAAPASIPQAWAEGGPG